MPITGTLRTRRAISFSSRAVATEIAATLSFIGVPEAEHQEFTGIIESYRAQVISL